jgi:hypothetical protein
MLRFAPRRPSRALAAGLAAFAAVAVLTATAPSAAAQKVTTPKEFFGHNIGDDYWLPTYTQFMGFWQKLAKESPRTHLDTIGLTAEGRPQLSMIVSSPENIRNMAKYREMAKKLAYAEIDEATARQFAKDGKAIVWIDGGLHASEVLGANQLIETSYQMISGADAETNRILNDVIIVFVHANPDGMELEANWYNKEPDNARKNLNTPTLYQKYIGHDNNRDFYIANQNESTNMNKWMYLTWYPQIMYNHHQTGPAGAVMFSPPFRDPANYYFHESIITGIDIVGAAIHARAELEHKPGVVSRSMSSYSTWWNGGLRTMAYFHNMIGILTETIGNPTPQTIPFIPARQLRFADYTYPLEPFQEWHFRQSIDYSVTANKAILDLAARNRDGYLYNIWRMGRDMIDRGSKDDWIVTPKLVADAEAKLGGGGRGRGNAPLDAFSAADFGGRGGGAGTKAQFTELFRSPANRVPRAFILPADQPDFLTAQKFLVSLQKAGIIVHRATAAFSAGGKQYPTGSYVVKGNQAFRAHVLDMFEPQDHPNDFAYPGAPPTRPYDNAGYTLAMQMGVKFDRWLEGGVDAWPLKRLDPLTDRIKPDPATVATGGAGWVFSPKVNDSFRAVARLWAAGVDVYRTDKPTTVGGVSYPAGSFYVAANAKSTPVVQKSAAELGVTFASSGDLSGAAAKVPAVRIGLWDRFGGSMPSGHMRWMFEQYEMPFKLVYPPELDAGNLRAKFDVLIFPESSIPAVAGGGGGRGGRGGRGGGGAEAVPAEFQNMAGNVSANTIAKLKEFVQQGGRLVAIGPSSINAAQQFGFPVTNHLVERTPTGTTGTPLPGEKFYVPGSILEVAYDTATTATRGQEARGPVFFDNSPVMRLGPDAALKGVKALAWYDNPSPLKSGWAWGQNYLEGGVAMAEGKYGQGTVYMFGPEITFRAQPAATFKLLFNSIVGDGRPNIVP